jgi:hypothetical protein
LFECAKNIENAKKYLNKFRLQRIIQDNKSKEAKYGVPKNCITGILEDSKELQAIMHPQNSPLDTVHSKISPLDTVHSKISPLDTVHPKNSPLDTVQAKNSPLDIVHPQNSPLDTVHSKKSPLDTGKSSVHMFVQKPVRLSIKKLTKNAHQMKFKLRSIFYLKSISAVYTHKILQK